MHDLLRQYAATLMSSQNGRVTSGGRRTHAEFYLHMLVTPIARSSASHACPIGATAPGVEPELFRDDSSAVNWFAKSERGSGRLFISRPIVYGELSSSLSSVLARRLKDGQLR